MNVARVVEEQKFVAGDGWIVAVGDVRESLRAMPVGSAHAVITSPPYYGLRDYKTEPLVWGGAAGCAHEWGAEARVAQSGPHRGLPEAGANSLTAMKAALAERAESSASSQGAYCQRCPAWRGSLGNEPSPKLYVAHLVEVFREVTRVLRPDGTLWLNLGDSFARDTTVRWDNTLHREAGWKAGQATRRSPNPVRNGEAKAKDLLGIPWSVAFALRDDGWYLRNDNIWAKNAVMPESVRDRMTRCHEYVFHFAHPDSGGRYFYDLVNGQEAATCVALRGPARDRRTDNNGNEGLARREPTGTRNRRTVWTVNPRPFKGAHFAVFPPDLVEPIVRIATSDHGVCTTCGASWLRVLKKHKVVGAGASARGADSKRADSEEMGSNARLNARRLGQEYEAERRAPETVGWRATCSCPSTALVPATILDPFSGSGTTAGVAVKHGRIGVGCELNPTYASLTPERVEYIVSSTAARKTKKKTKPNLKTN